MLIQTVSRRADYWLVADIFPQYPAMSDVS